MSPFQEFVNNLPTTAVYYIGGSLAGSGSMNPADLNGFRIAMNTMIDSARRMYNDIFNLMELEDRRFEPVEMHIGLPPLLYSERPHQGSQRDRGIMWC